MTFFCIYGIYGVEPQIAWPPEECEGSLCMVPAAFCCRLQHEHVMSLFRIPIPGQAGFAVAAFSKNNLQQQQQTSNSSRYGNLIQSNPILLMFFQDRATLTGQAGIFQPLSGADRAPQLLYKIEARFCRVVGWGLCWDSLWIEIDTVLSFFGEDVGQLRHFFVCLFAVRAAAPCWRCCSCHLGDATSLHV